MAVRKIPPDWHYVSATQSELWRAVAAAHAPSSEDGDPVAVAYGEIFDETATALSGSQVHLVGMGAGAGQKERKFAQALGRAGCDVEFTAVDVSEALAFEAARGVGEVIAGKTQVMVGDFREAGAFLPRLADSSDGRRQVFTGFGLSPNLHPDEFFPKVRCLLDADDGAALVSANLWPAGSDAQRELLSQYDNPETRRWLGQLFVEWEVTEAEVPELEFSVGETDGVAAVQAFATWPELGKRLLESAPSMVEGWRSGDRIEVFSSLRYTTDNFAQRAEVAGMLVQTSRSSTCGREAIFWLAGMSSG
jgi:hypothetical protein